MHSLWFVDLSLTVIWLFSWYLSLASAGHGSFMWFCIRMAFKSILVPKCWERLPDVEFYNQIWIGYLCSSIWRRNFLEGLCRLIAYYVVLLLRLHYVLTWICIGFHVPKYLYFDYLAVIWSIDHVKWFFWPKLGDILTAVAVLFGGRGIHVFCLKPGNFFFEVGFGDHGI